MRTGHLHAGHDVLAPLRVTVDAVPRWRPVLPPGRAAAALGVAHEVIARLGDPARLARAVALAAEQTRHPEIVGWRPHSLAHGDAGLALLWGYLDAVLPDRGWDALARTHLEAAARAAAELAPLPASLWGGLGGVAFAASYASRQGTRYRRFLTAVDDALLPQLHAHADAMRGATAPGGVHAFDLITGLAGSGAYLLHRRADPRCGEALHAVLAALVALATGDGGRPRWWTPPEYLQEESRALHPFGNLNCGLAHGIPGPLALLALSEMQGITVNGAPGAITRMADWLCEHRADDEWGVNWPYAVGLPPTEPMDGTARDIADAAPRPGTATSRAAWCYGSPGVARALWLAGQALDEERYRALAVDAMEAVLRRPLVAREVGSAPFCHGTAGLLHIVLRFAHDTGHPPFVREAGALVEQLVSLYEPERPVGYYSVEAGSHRVDNPGLLDGAAGVVLVLLAACTDVEPEWDRVFLLS